ncbi:MAG: TIGR02996 domain-containing protein, partial [Gemmataceae bacterium]|nr:TIGR02996 domain-containing protein [Gemmataceae bacterium]
MDAISFLLAALRAAPGDELAWLALADGLEEAGQTARAELSRLTRRLLPLPR